MSAGGIQESIFDKFYIYTSSEDAKPGAELCFNVSYMKQKSVSVVKMVRGHWFTVTFLLQAWRKYDSDRSGYIESNELKVKRVFQKSLTWKVNVV